VKTALTRGVAFVGNGLIRGGLLSYKQEVRKFTYFYKNYLYTVNGNDNEKDAQGLN
jgi:hypothetical protein